MEHKQRSFAVTGFKALDDQQGIFEAIVAVFGNVDRAGDKIIPGAFKDTLEAWKAKGRPIPVIFSHEWENLDAHIGEVLEAKEVEQGLYVRGQLDMEEDFARRVYKRMKRGTLAEFSFAYDVVDAVQAKAGGEYVNELRKLDLLEVGPCLVGMNPDTQLLGVKEGRRNSSKDMQRIQQIHDLCVELGAKCAESGDSGGEGEGTPKDEAGDGKSSGASPSAYATRVALDLMELGNEV
jgi:HK97 family phage prohead protease